MRAWIIGAGIIDNPAFFRSIKVREKDIIICADGGYDHARLLGFHPNVVIGDMDSINSEVSDESICIKYPVQKDKTDTQLAVEYAIEQGCSELVLLGMTGGRMDHTIANIMLLSYIADHNAEGMILTGYERIGLIINRTTIKRGAGDGISFIPITLEVTGVETSGLLYDMHNVTLKKGDTLSVSNEFRAPEAEVSIKSGRLLMVCDI